MSNNANFEEKERDKTSKKQFDLIVKICLVSGIIIISGFIIYYALTPEPGYITFGILNEDREAENYAIVLYRKVIAEATRLGDITTKKLFEDIIQQEEEHYWAFDDFLP